SFLFYRANALGKTLSISGSDSAFTDAIGLWRHRNVLRRHILTDYPISWLALAAPLALRGKTEKNGSPLGWFMTVFFLLILACAATICLF
ncbi:MAG TPA: hypothetical protein VNU95_02490, partial [Candidatus Acidoferrales bacterium]|nr:hypothetical protein [Candidatus Acidoferrales bacterium]